MVDASALDTGSALCVVAVAVEVCGVFDSADRRVEFGPLLCGRVLYVDVDVEFRGVYALGGLNFDAVEGDRVENGLSIVDVRYVRVLNVFGAHDDVFRWAPFRLGVFDEDAIYITIPPQFFQSVFEPIEAASDVKVREAFDCA